MFSIACFIFALFLHVPLVVYSLYLHHVHRTVVTPAEEITVETAPSDAIPFGLKPAKHSEVRIPIHFGISGRPDNFSSNPTALLLYPGMSVLLGLCSVGICFIPDYLNFAVVLEMVASGGLILLTQVYTYKIVKGEAEGIPPKLFYPFLLAMLLITLLVVCVAFTI
ncbi:hypothetical protein, conserved [Angomonas deanei]|uniref:DUF1648 domain-containing protein n=1 Tax=Angomonas deanei TaxID=59799 RepID=A0A7G2C0N3_9TRYP|nr:hypothetical protein, conserved [Angomonas deanei]